MMKLLKLKQQYAWSILIIAHTPKRHAWAPITQNDLAGSKKLFNYFDSVFAIGLSSKDENFRFVKQLKVRYGGFSYGAGSVMVFELSKDDDMVRLNFLYTEPEKNHLSEPDDKDIIQRDMRVVELHKQGLNYRDIAAQVGISKSMVGKIIAKAEQSTTASTVYSVDKVDTIPDDIVARSIRPTLDSDLITFLRTLFDPITVSSLIQEYRIGGTREKAVIFYQIDIQG